MKRMLAVSTIITFMLAVYVYAKTTVIYQTEDKNIVENNRENDIEIKWTNQQVIRGAIETICRSTKEIKETIEERCRETDKDEYAEQWLGEHVSGIRISSITQEDVDRIAGTENLESLVFSISEDNIDLSPLSRLTYLRELTIYFTGSADDLDLSFIKELSLLTEIYFDKCTSLEDLSLFEDMRCLKELHVGYVDDVDLNYLSSCVNLESINICGGHIRNAEGLSNLMSLHSLGLIESAPGKEPSMNDLEQISNLKGLESVQLRFINVSDDGLLSDLPNLRQIFLVGTGISDIESLNNLERLESLMIFGNESERVTEQAEIYFKDVEEVTITEDIPNNLRNYQ